MTLKNYIRGLLDEGLSDEQAWHKAEAEGRHAPWNYVRKIARDWGRERADEPAEGASR